MRKRAGKSEIAPKQAPAKELSFGEKSKLVSALLREGKAENRKQAWEMLKAKQA